MSIQRFAMCLLLLGLPLSGLRGEDRPGNLAQSAVASASSTYTSDGYSPSRVNDGRRSTARGGNTSWSNAWQPLPQWVQLEWPSPITFSRVDLYLTMGYEMLNFTIEFRASAEAPWQILTTVIDNRSTTPGPYVAPRPGTATAQAIRLVGTLGPARQPDYIRVNEIEVY